MALSPQVRARTNAEALQQIRQFFLTNDGESSSRAPQPVPRQLQPATQHADNMVDDDESDDATDASDDAESVHVIEQGHFNAGAASMY